jgi:hypothetical protein
MGLAPILYIASECQGKQLSKAHSILNKNSGVYFIHFAGSNHSQKNLDRINRIAKIKEDYCIEPLNQ